MKKIYCVICDKYKKYRTPKISHIFERSLAVSIICRKYDNEDTKIFKEKESIQMLKMFGLFENIYFKNMTEENIIETIT